MRGSWLGVVESVLRPARPELPRCLREREAHLASRKLDGERRLRALADCEARITQARADVFASGSGVVTARMTDLEREWRTLARVDPDAGLMDFWARVAPASWLDRKRWRDAPPAARLDVAVALAADPEGVEAAEASVASLRRALAPWGVDLGPRVHWRPSEGDPSVAPALLERPLEDALDAVASREEASIVLAYARRLAAEVHDAAHLRLPGRPSLAFDVAYGAFVEAVWSAAFADAPCPAVPLRDLWATGYSLASADDAGVTLGVPLP